MKKITNIELSNDPDIHVRSVLFFDDEGTIKEKNRKQFVTTKESSLQITFDDGSILTLFAPANFTFDGATIPLGIGKGNMKLQIPALFHDIMCNEKFWTNYDRKLADTIFKECLIKCGVNRVIAEWMFLHVEIYQKLFCDWRNPNEQR